jgi:uncharacterized protein (TIGR02271 family)
MNQETLRGDRLDGRTIYASDGEKLGKVDEILTDGTGQPQYVRVRSGWFGTKQHVVPVSGLTATDDGLTAPYTKAQLESAPTFDEDEDVDYDRERALGSHYGHDVPDWDDERDRWTGGEDLSRGPTPETRHPDDALDDVRDTTQGPTPETRRAMRTGDDDAAAASQPQADARTRADLGGDQDRWEGTGADAPGTVGRDVSGPTTDDAMTRSEEELRVGTAAHEAGRVRLRKWIETEPVSESVTTRRETARVEREPITDANIDRATDGPELSEEEHEVTLSAEEVVVEKRTVPKERVRLDTDVVEEEQTVSEELRKERIAVEGDVEGDDLRGR